jgi:zinc transport system substrate-binding protein
MKKIVFVLALIGITIATGSAAQEKIHIVTSFYLPFDFTKHIGGDRVRLTNLVQAGAEPHDYEPTPKDIQTIESAQVFIYNGAGFESWVPRTLASVKNKDKLIVVETSKGLLLRKAPDDEEEFAFDPHAWLDPILVKEMGKNIAVGLTQAESAGKSIYETNLKNFQSKLDELDAQIKKGLSKCKHKALIISHQFFDYFGARYNLQIESLSGLEPGEPTPKRLTELIKFGKEKGLKYIFAEPLSESKAIETLARELGAKILTLDPIEGLTEEEEKAGANYLSLMSENLKSLRIGLECE